MNRRKSYELHDLNQRPQTPSSRRQLDEQVSRADKKEAQEVTSQLDFEVMEFIAENMIKRRAQYFGPGHWGVLLALAITGESTFVQINAWLEDDIGAEISSSTLRESIKTLESLGMIRQTGDELSTRGPKSARYAITNLGLQQVERAPRAPIAHAG